MNDGFQRFCCWRTVLPITTPNGLTEPSQGLIELLAVGFFVFVVVIEFHHVQVYVKKGRDVWPVRFVPLRVRNLKHQKFQVLCFRHCQEDRVVWCLRAAEDEAEATSDASGLPVEDVHEVVFGNGLCAR